MEGQSLESALQVVHQCGIGAFEFWGWWDKDLSAVIEARDRFGLEIAACCTRFISLVNPAVRNDYLQGLRESIDAATRLNCPTLISQVGDAIPDTDREVQHQSLVDGLKQAAPMLEQAGVTLVIEPLNEIVDHPGYYLTRSDEAFEIIDQVGSDRVKVVYDIYHQQITEGHLIDTITRNVEKIGHFHAAGNPGRHELTSGEIDYGQVFQAIQATNYDGYVGLEYWPLDPVPDGLKRAAALIG